jgi:hypothetical protein
MDAGLMCCQSERVMLELGSTKANTTTILVGILTSAIGAIPPLSALGILPRGHDVPDAAPPWIGWMIGLMFVGAGIVVVMKGIAGNADDASGSLPVGTPRLLRAAYDLLAATIVRALAVLFTWVAFGPGVRHFSVSFGGLSMPTSGAGDSLGRVAFGVGAVLIWCFAIAVVVAMVRRWWR